MQSYREATHGTGVTRFRSKIVAGPATQDCWIWTGAIGDDGYGRFWTPTPDGGQRMIRAHRYALALVTGSLATLDELHVCHMCDNPICVRVEDSPSTHLYAGTAFDNMTDCAARGHHNQQPTAAFFRHETKQQRAHACCAITCAPTATALRPWQLCYAKLLPVRGHSSELALSPPRPHSVECRPHREGQAGDHHEQHHNCPYRDEDRGRWISCCGSCTPPAWP